jgi:inhibitor of cysteine peptidase
VLCACIDMLHKRLAIFAMLAAVFAASTLLAQAPPRTVDIDDSQNGGKLMVFQGDTVEVRLLSTPGTGYSWKVSHTDTAVLAQKKAPVFVPPPQNIPGAEGHLVFDFLASAPGRSTLQLAYARPWEKDVAPAKTFNVEVTVRPASDRPLPQP